MALVSIMLTHRVAGPLMRIRRMVTDVAEGHLRPPPYGLRDKDELKDIFDATRAMIHVLRKQQEDDALVIGHALERAQQEGVTGEWLEDLRRWSRASAPGCKTVAGMSRPKGIVGRAISKAVQVAQVAAGTVVMAAVLLRPNKAGSERARRNAEQIIAACKAFHERHGRFPQTLEELVPGFLPSIPPAKYTGSPFGFTYDVEPDARRHVLGWTEVIPFGRPYYVLEEDWWGYLD